MTLQKLKKGHGLEKNGREAGSRWKGRRCSIAMLRGPRPITCNRDFPFVDARHLVASSCGKKNQYRRQHLIFEDLKPRAIWQDLKILSMTEWRCVLAFKSSVVSPYPSATGKLR